MRLDWSAVLVLITAAGVMAGNKPDIGFHVFDVVIVGGGTAGTAAASRLVENGVTNILVLEAEDRLGGRISTVPFGNYVVDMGAQYIHGEEGNEVFKHVEHLNITSPSQLPGLLIGSCGQFENSMAFSNLNSRSAEILQKPELRNYKGSIEEFFDPWYKELVTELEVSPELAELFRDWFSKMECINDGCDTMSQQGARGFANYVECKGDQELIWKSEGYQKFYNILLGKALRADAQLDQMFLTSKEVAGINWEGDHVLLQCQNDSQYHAHRVIFTPSLGVLKSLSEDYFQPPLPEQKRTAIEKLGYGAVAKIHLMFSEQWWPNSSFTLNLGWLQADKTAFQAKSKYGDWTVGIAGFTAYPSQPKVLTAWIAGAAARGMEKATDTNVIDACEEILHYFLDCHYHITKPIAMKRSRWFLNPHFKGSYSFDTVESDALNVTREHLSQPLMKSNNDPIVMFAGEATDPKYFSTVHGALETGWREAERVIKLKQLRQTP